MEKRLSDANKRNIGIDFLRILSMFYVLILHTLGQGGILASAAVGTNQYKVSWFLEVWAFCAVDIFALISGYVGYSENERAVKYSNYISLWFQIVFYGIVVTLVYSFFHPELVTKKDLIEMFFPVTNDLYWYFTAYTGLFIFMPFLNRMISKCSKKGAVKLFIVLFFVFSVHETFMKKFVLNEGYCFSWLVILYILGLILKKCEIGKQKKCFNLFLGILLLVFITWSWKVYGFEWAFLSIHMTQDTLLSYTSPTILGAAILYIILFSKINFKHFRKMISFAASGAFAGYILNTQRFIWTYEIANRFSSWAGENFYIILLKVIAFSGVFLFAAILIDQLRNKLFQYTRLNKLILLLGQEIKIIFNFFTKGFEEN